MTYLTISKNHTLIFSGVTSGIQVGIQIWYPGWYPNWTPERIRPHLQPPQYLKLLFLRHKFLRTLFQAVHLKSLKCIIYYQNSYFQFQFEIFVSHLIQWSQHEKILILPKIRHLLFSLESKASVKLLQLSLLLASCGKLFQR